MRGRCRSLSGHPDSGLHFGAPQLDARVYSWTRLLLEHPEPQSHYAAFCPRSSWERTVAYSRRVGLSLTKIYSSAVCPDTSNSIPNMGVLEPSPPRSQCRSALAARRGLQAYAAARQWRHHTVSSTCANAPDCRVGRCNLSDGTTVHRFGNFGITQCQEAASNCEICL